MSDQTTVQGTEDMNQSSQGEADKAQGASSGSTQDMKAYTDKIAILEADNKKYRDQRRESEELTKKKEQEEAEKTGQFEKLYHEEKAKVEVGDKKLADIAKEKEAENKSIEKEYKTSLDKLTPDNKKLFLETFGDMTDNPKKLLRKLDKFNPSINNPTAANSIPSSAGNEDQIKAMMDKIKTDPEARKKFNNPADINELLKGTILSNQA